MNIETAFRLFDVRGDCPGAVDERLAFIVGRSLVQIHQPQNILVASDTRETSPSLKRYLIDGISSPGVTLTDLYEAPVGLFNFCLATQNFDLGVMVTASHVEASENGFKFAHRGGIPFDQEEVKTVKDLCFQYQNINIVSLPGSTTRYNANDTYLGAILERVPLNEVKAKIVVDISKSSIITQVLTSFAKIGIPLNITKSLRSGNPLQSENRQSLADEVRKLSADLGIIWDSDGDRVVFVDRSGIMIPPSFVLGVLGASEVQKNRGQRVGVDVRAGLVVRDLVEAAGGTVEVFPAWSQYFKFAMRDDPRICFAGETSGHCLFSDFYNIDDGLYTALKFLALWEQGFVEEKLQRLAKSYYELPEINLPCSFKSSSDILEGLTDFYREKGFKVSIVDGLTVFGPDFKFNVRQSLTEDLLRLNLETKKQNMADKIVQEIEDRISKYE